MRKSDAGAISGTTERLFFGQMIGIIDFGRLVGYLHTVIVNRWSGLVDRSEYMPAWKLPRVEEQNKNCLQHQGKWITDEMIAAALKAPKSR
jgi:hypothetical protein